MINKLKLCKGCGKPKYLFSKGMCKVCATLRNLSKERTAKKVAPKREKRGRATRLQGQRELFTTIWNSRPHVSEISGQGLLPLGDERWHWQFMHVLSKGAFPKFKFREDNVILGTVDEHTIQTGQEHKIYNKETDTVLDKRWEGFYERKRKLLREYYEKS